MCITESLYCIAEIKIVNQLHFNKKLQENDIWCDKLLSDWSK